MTSEQILAIEAERYRQNALHPVAFSTLLPAGEMPADHLRKMARYRSVNNQLEARGEHDAMHLALEELYEFFTAETKEEQLAEAIQNIAFWVRIYEELA
jgi:hypothetical protein